MSHAFPSPSAGDPDAANARALIAACQAGTQLDHLPQAVATLDEAYRVQTAFVAAAGGIGGWKVSPLRPGAPPRCSPIPAPFIRSPAASVAGPRGSDWLVEIEIAVRLKAGLSPAGGAVTRAAVAAAIDTVHPAIEIVESRLVAGLDAPDLDRVADLQCCGGVILGPGRTDWQALDFSAEIAELTSGRETVRSEVVQPATGETLDALVWLAGHAAERGSPLRAGQVIITGARLGPLPLVADADAVARVGAIGTLHLPRLAAPA